MRVSLVTNHRVPLIIVILVSLASFLGGLTFTGVSHLSLFVIPHSTVVWGLLMIGVALSAPVVWRRGKTAVVERGYDSSLVAPGEVLQRALAALVASTSAKLLLGPAVGVLVWCLPLGAEPMAHKALAIMAFIVMYWISEPLDYGVAALLGCYLFWALGGMKFSVAFSGFASSTPWFVLGVILLGQAAATKGWPNALASMLYAG